MNKALLLGTSGIVAAFAFLAVGYLAGKPQTATSSAPQAASTDLDRSQVERIVRDYLLANPEVISEAQAALEVKQQEQQRVANLQVIQDNKAEIFSAATDGIIGNPTGRVTIVEFYDYNCGYCRRAQADMLALTKSNPDLRFVLKEFPILGPDSQKAHVVSQAFVHLMPAKFEEFHNQLIGSKGRATEEAAIRIALSLGADEAKLREEMKNPAISGIFGKTYDLANKLQITGTPSYVIGDEVVFGALGEEALSEKIAAAAAACTQEAC